MAKSFEYHVLAAFFISISLNALVLLFFEWLGLGFEFVGLPLAIISVALILLAVLKFAEIKEKIEIEISVTRVVFYGLIFFMLFINGGLIESVSDAWWHMSLANKIGMEGRFIPEVGHLTGLPSRYYPPLWHGNLALANLLSGESIPVLWNSFTSWGAAFKVMAFYLFAFALTRNQSTAFIAAILFVLLPGMGNSYLRVSSWPSHVSYTAMFLCLHIAFVSLDQMQYAKGTNSILSLNAIAGALKRHALNVFLCIALLVIILFTHKAELLYLGFLACANFAALMIVKVVYGRQAPFEVEKNATIINIVGALVAIIVILFTLYRAMVLVDSQKFSLDILVAFTVPILWLVLLLFAFSDRQQRFLRLIKGGLMLIALLTLFLISWRHFYSLFNPSVAFEVRGSHAAGAYFAGVFGGDLVLPSWRLQLRSALLYSGILSLPLSLWLVVKRLDRANLFVCVNAWLTVLLCSSPYLYTWLYWVADYHSPWRLVLLVFHPICISILLMDCWQTLKGDKQ